MRAPFACRYVELESALALAEQHWETSLSGDSATKEDLQQLQAQLTEQTLAAQELRVKLEQVCPFARLCHVVRLDIALNHARRLYISAPYDMLAQLVVE